MAKVEIYISMMCPYCSRAIKLLQSKNISFQQIDVSMDGTLRQRMRNRAGGHTSVHKSLLMMNISVVAMS